MYRDHCYKLSIIYINQQEVSTDWPVVFVENHQIIIEIFAVYIRRDNSTFQITIQTSLSFYSWKNISRLQGRSKDKFITCTKQNLRNFPNDQFLQQNFCSLNKKVHICHLYMLRLQFWPENSAILLKSQLVSSQTKRQSIVSPDLSR